MKTEKIESAESAKQSDIPENQFVSTATNKEIMVVAPHAVMGDDDFTGVIAQSLAEVLDCSAVINNKYQKPESVDETEPDYENYLANLNNWEHIEGDKTVKQEFLAPIQDFIADVKNLGGHAVVPLIHGISDEHTKLVAEKLEIYKESPNDLQIILGFGQGGNNYTANQKKTILPLIRHFSSEGINAAIAPPRPIIGTDGKKKTYCAADPNCLSQNLYDPNGGIEYVQFEIPMSGFREDYDLAIETGRRIGNALSRLIPGVKKDKPIESKLTQFEFRKPSDLKPHPLNSQIYGEKSPDTDLLNSIKERNILTPLTILGDGTILSGHKRHACATRIRLEKVPVTIFQSTDPLEIEEALIKANLQRQKTKEQIAREYSKLKEIEAEKAKQRKVEAGRIHGKGQKVQENFPKPIGKGQARDIASAKLGASGRTLEKSVKVVETADKLKEVGETAKADGLLYMLNNKSVDKAYKAFRKLETEGSAPIPSEKPTPNKTAENNKTNEAIYQVDLIYVHKDEIKQKFEVLDDEDVTAGIKHRIEERVTLTLPAESEKDAADAALQMAKLVVEKGIKPSKIETIKKGEK